MSARLRYAALALVALAACADEGRTPMPGGPSRSRDAGGNERPRVTITSPAEGARIALPGNVRLEGSATDPEDGALPASRLSWMSDQDGDLGTGSPLEVTLSPGPHLLTLVAVDSSSVAGSAQVHVRVGDTGGAPTAAIDEPMDGATFREGQAITFRGRGMDAEDGMLPGTSLFWSSSKDGALGSGASVTLQRPMLGEHVIVLTAVDSDGMMGLASIRVTVAPAGTNLPPAVSITAPMNGASVVTNTQVELRGRATDPEDGALSGNALEWRSDVEGRLGTGETLTLPRLSRGVHRLTLTATDSMGLSGSADVTITVNEPGNSPPVPMIASPRPGTVVFAGASVMLIGSARDPEDGMLPGAQLAWRSNLDGNLGTGATLTVTTLRAGDHTLTLVATDSRGAGATAQVDLRVLPANSAPRVSITAPPDGSQRTAGTPIDFTGVAVDSEDGAIPGSSLVWQSDRDGTMGNGATLRFSSLTVGTHRITLTAVDSAGAPGTAAITVIIAPSQANLPPVALLGGPMTGDTGAMLIFDGSGSSDRDGTITSYRFDFGDGTTPAMGTASRAAHTYAAAGMYTVVLTVTDDDGAMSTAMLRVTITDPVRTPMVVVDVTDTLGDDCAIAVDGSNRPQVVFVGTTHGQLFHSAWDGTQWNTTLVDGPGFDSGGLVQEEVSMAVSAQGVPHIAYRHSTNGAIRYATRAAPGAQWRRERVSTMYDDNVRRPMEIALEPGSGTPVIAWTYQQQTSPYYEQPVVARRTQAGAWVEQIHSGATGQTHFLGGLVFDSTDTAWLSVGSSPQIVKWKSGMGFFGAESAATNISTGTRAPLVLDGAGQPILVSGDRTYHKTASGWIVTPFHTSGVSLVDAAYGPMDRFVVALNHGNQFELAVPDPLYSYIFAGPMDGVALDIAMDTRGDVRACFFRSGNLVVY